MGDRTAVVNLPNLVTIGRILLVPVAVWCMMTAQHVLAFSAFVIAGISDGVDGYLARRFGWKSELGTYLDPLADKALLVSIYLVLAIVKVVPLWLAITVVTRDLLIVGAVILSWLMEKPVAMQPLPISKINTATQIGFAGAILGLLALEMDYSQFTQFGAVIVVILTVASLAHYMRNWLRHMSEGA